MVVKSVVLPKLLVDVAKLEVSFVSDHPPRLLTSGGDDRLPVADTTPGDAADVLLLLDVAENQHEHGQLLALLSGVLDATIERNESIDQLPSTLGCQHLLPTGKLTAFHGLRPPPISIEAYLDRIAKYTKCSPVCFVMSLLYMDILCQRDDDMAPTSLNVHRLLLTGIMLAAKFMDDHYYNNSYYAKVGGISTHELNKLELELLKLLDFRLYVSPDIIKTYLRQIQSGCLVLGSYDFSKHSVGKKRRSCAGADGEERRTQRRSSVGDFFDDCNNYSDV